MDPSKRHKLLYQASCGPDKEKAKEELRNYVAETYITQSKFSWFKNKIVPYMVGILLSQVALWIVYKDLGRNIFSGLFTSAVCLLWELFLSKGTNYARRT